ncbi:MAG: hypothetical protein ACPG7F_01185 [Aggregatilineales bacterium]
MVYGIEDDYKIVAGFNNAATLSPVQWYTVTIQSVDYAFPIPEGLSGWQDALTEQALGGRIVTRGYAATRWVFPWLAPEMLRYMRDTWRGPVTIRTAPGVRAHANYNAVLTVPSPQELGRARIITRGAYDGQNTPYTGPGWANVAVAFNRVEAL